MRLKLMDGTQITKQKQLYSGYIQMDYKYLPGKWEDLLLFAKVKNTAKLDKTIT